MRLLIADFRYHQCVDDTIWLDHAHRANGRVIFYPDGLISSIDHREFATITMGEGERFNAFMRFVKPATRVERFHDWAEPFYTIGCAIVLFFVLPLIAAKLIQAVWPK